MEEEKKGVDRRTSWGFHYNVVTNGDSSKKRTSESFGSHSLSKKVKEQNRASVPASNTGYIQRMNENLDRELRLSEDRRSSLPNHRFSDIGSNLNDFFTKHLGEDPTLPAMPIHKQHAQVLEVEAKKPANQIQAENIPSMGSKIQVAFANNIDMLDEKSSRKSEVFFPKNNPSLIPDTNAQGPNIKNSENIKPEVIAIDEEPDPANQNINKVSSAIQPVNSAQPLLQEHLSRFNSLKKSNLIVKIREVDIANIEHYLFQKFRIPSDIKKLNSRRINFEKFLKIFNQIADLEILNLKGQKLFQLDAFTMVLQTFEPFLKELVDQLTRETKNKLKVIIEKPNLKNVYMTEKNVLISNLIKTFQGILSTLEEIDSSRRGGLHHYKEELLKTLQIIKKSGKYLIYQKDLSEDLNRKNICFVEKNLKSFFDAAKMLESGFEELNEINTDLVRMDRCNEYNYQRLYKNFYEPMSDVFEASSLDLARDWLRLSD
jgi:hypothetical protein